MLVAQLAHRIVNVKATKSRQIRAEHAFLDSRHRERVDWRVIVVIAGHVDRHQPVVGHGRQLSGAELRHLDALVLLTQRRDAPEC